MLRRILATALLGTGLATGLTLTPASADAHPSGEFHHNHRFEVLVHRGHHGWQNHGVFHDRRDAERASQHLRHEGFQVQIREF